MDDALLAISNRLALVTDLKYVDEDWGQLDYYQQNPPVKWPCALVDINAATWDNLPKGVQLGKTTIRVLVASLKLSNSQTKAPMVQRQKTFEIHSLLRKVHQQLHNWQLPEHGRLTRASTRRIKRDDGIQQYEVLYSLQYTDTSAEVISDKKTVTAIGVIVERWQS